MSNPACSIDGRSRKRPGIEAQRERILKASVELFCQRGSRAVSISELCVAAEVSRPTFYKCFEDKSALIHALYEDAVNQPVEAVMLAALNADSIHRQSIEDALGQLIDSIFDHAGVAALVFAESGDPESPASTIIDNAFDRIATAMQNSISKGTGKKPSKVFLKSMMAACQWIVHDSIRKGLTAKNRCEAKAAVYEIARLIVKD